MDGRTPYERKATSLRLMGVVKRLAEVDAWLVRGVSYRDMVVNVEAVIGGSSPTFGPSKEVSVKKPGGGESSCQKSRTLSSYKARLVANGSSQQLGADFDETCSPVVKLATIRMVFSLVVSRKWRIHQLDVKNAFLNGDLSKTVYMHQPPGFVDARFPNHVMPHGLDFITVVAVLLYSFIDRDLSSSDLPLYARSARATFSCSQVYLAICSGYFGFRPSLICILHYLSVPKLNTGVLLTLWQRLHGFATLVYSDNVSAVYMSVNHVQHQRTKHIEIDIHIVRDMVTAGQVRVLHVPSRFQYADIFTNGLPSALFEEFRSSLSVRPPPALTAGAY
ncbi:ribonuclease H-like domain-containing protein [Tanacetum coccineum]